MQKLVEVAAKESEPIHDDVRKWDSAAPVSYTF
jgi:hypothetical protein